MLLFRNDTIAIYACQLHDAASIHHDADAERHAVQSLLKEAFPDNKITLAHTPTGAPQLLRPGGHAISITHSRTTVAVAIATADIRIGIDTETTDRITQLQRIAHRFLTPEQAQLWASPSITATHPNSLLVAWCIKEALYKAALTPGLPLHDIPLPHPTFITAHTATVTLADRLYTLHLLPSAPLVAVVSAN